MTHYYVRAGFARTSDPLSRPSEEVYVRVPRLVYEVAWRLGCRGLAQIH